MHQVPYPLFQLPSVMAAKMPEFNYCCEICGAEGMSDSGMREHVMVCHVKNAVSCPFCDLCQISEVELATHVNTAHLDYLTPEQEMMAFIDDDDISPRDAGGIPKPLSHKENINNNNNNNNVEFFEDRLKNGESWGSPQRSQLALNLRPQTIALKCPLCAFTHNDASKMEQHINRQHFDLTSPSIPVESPTTSYSESTYNCPLCTKTFENTPDLELHVNIEHKDILSPANPTLETVQDKSAGLCPICCMGNFKSTDDLAHHIEEHFSQKGLSPMTPDVSSDRLLAKEMEKRDKEVQRLREQHEFQLLRAQYGMDNEGNFKEQSLTNMQRAVYSGELSVADYYERQIELKMAESTGVDDSSSCTRDIVTLVSAASSSSSNVVRVHLCTIVDHYASTYGDKGWGCGYRNMQMMLSSLFHHTGFNETLYRQWSIVSGRIEPMPPRSAMPSISRLQACVEWAWTQGFDTQGSEQLGGSLANTRKWIGATEVVTVLSSLRIRCQLVDFHRPTSPNGSHPDLFSWVLDYFQSYNEFKPPLYLQHQGHSRTIVGVEELRDGGLNLLVLDPSHSPLQMGELCCTLTSCNAMRLIRKGYGAMKAKQYQVVAITGIMETEIEYQRSKVLRSERIPQDR